MATIEYDRGEGYRLSYRFESEEARDLFGDLFTAILNVCSIKPSPEHVEEYEEEHPARPADLFGIYREPAPAPVDSTNERYKRSREAVKAAILSHGCTFGDFCSRACGFNGWHDTPKKEFAALNHGMISTLAADCDELTNTERSARRGYLFRAVIAAFPTASASLHVVKPAAGKVSWFEAEPWDEGTIEEFRALAEFSHPGLKYHAGV